MGALVVVVVIGMTIYVRHLFAADRIKLTRADRTCAPWFQLATYAEGRITHATPMRDGIHIEDETGDCACHPAAGVYRTADDRSGVFYTHHSLAAAQSQPAPTRVPRRFRPGWRWPE